MDSEGSATKSQNHTIQSYFQAVQSALHLLYFSTMQFNIVLPSRE